MKILLDECVPRQLADILSQHECATVQGRGWQGIRNSELLEKASAEFDIFVTADQGISYQQNLTNFSICVLQLSTNDLRRIRAAAKIIDAATASMREGEFREVVIP